MIIELMIVLTSRMPPLDGSYFVKHEQEVISILMVT